MRISVRRSGNGISETIRDLEAVPGEIYGNGGAIVHNDGERLNRFARNISRAKAGPHGKDFFKRISATMVGPLAIEVGPSALEGTRYTGVDSEGGPGRDLDEALDKIRPVFHKHAAELMDDLL